MNPLSHSSAIEGLGRQQTFAYGTQAMGEIFLLTTPFIERLSRSKRFLDHGDFQVRRTTKIAVLGRGLEGAPNHSI
jgi:hypothetical protein